MWINSEHVELTITDPLITDNFSSSSILLKSTWNSIEIQTNLNQRLLINTTHWSLEFDHSNRKKPLRIISSKSYFLELFNYFKQFQTNKTISQRRTSNFRYIDSSLLPTSNPILSNNILNKFDEFIEYLHEPFLNLSIRHFHCKYKSIFNTEHNYTIDTTNFSFHNSSKSTNETQHAYIANFRLYSHSTLLIHGLCQINVNSFFLFSNRNSINKSF